MKVVINNDTGGVGGYTITITDWVETLGEAESIIAAWRIGWGDRK